MISFDGYDYALSPAYDLLAVRLTGIEDNDELAMPLTGRGSENGEVIGGYDRGSFETAMCEAGINLKTSRWIIDKMISNKDRWFEELELSFLPQSLKDRYKSLIEDRLSRLT